MNIKNLAEVFAILDKMQIDNNPNLTDLEKEVLKQFIDDIKNKVKKYG